MEHKKKVMQHLYDLQPEVYHKRYKDIQYAKYRQLFHLMDVQKNLTLDAGIGTGTILTLWQNISRLVGIDLSIQALAFASEDNFQQKPLLVNADIENLPFRNQCFFQIFSITVGQNLPTMRFLDEIKRILRINGSSILSFLRKNLISNIFAQVKRVFSNKEVTRFDNESFEDTFFIIQPRNGA